MTDPEILDNILAFNLPGFKEMRDRFPRYHSSK